MARSTMTGHRRHVSTGKRTQKAIYLSVQERALIAAAAPKVRLAQGAFIAAAAVRAARAVLEGDTVTDAAPTADAAPVGRGELSMVHQQQVLDAARDARRLLGNVAGNLNDVARHANSTGELAPQTEEVLAYVRRSAERADAELMAALRRIR